MARKFAHVNATPEQLWHWFRMKGEKPEDDCFFELRLINSEDLSEAPTSDMKLYRKHVADNWFRDFKGVEDANGDTPENTPEARLEILKDLTAWPFISGKILAASDLEAEGKGDSGSVS